MVEKQLFILSWVSSTIFPVFYIIQDTNRTTILIIFWGLQFNQIHYFLPWLKYPWNGQWVPDKGSSNSCVLRSGPERKECLSHEQQIWIAAH